LIVDDHTLVRQGLCSLIATNPEVEVVGEASNGQDAIKLAGTLMPELILMDLSMPGINGTESTKEIKRRYPKVKVLVLTVHAAEEYIKEALKAGADGYILKHASETELRLAIKSVLNGKTYLSPDVAEQVVNSYLVGGNSPNPGSVWDSITLREREVLKLIAEGHPNKFIATYLCVSLKTIEKHRSNLMKKLDMHNAASLTSFAIKKGLL
jgi:DNA-binding NarL/FixJ family response regulator